MHKNWVNVAELVHHAIPHHNYEVVNRCVYNLNVMVVKLWANIINYIGQHQTALIANMGR